MAAVGAGEDGCMSMIKTANNLRNYHVFNDSNTLNLIFKQIKQLKRTDQHVSAPSWYI